MSNIKTITIDGVSYSLEDSAARTSIETLSGTEETEGSIKNIVKAASAEIQSNFQAGVDSIYDAIVAEGTTPASKSHSDIKSEIDNVVNIGYNAGLNNAYIGAYDYLKGRELATEVNAVATFIANSITDMSNMFNGNKEYIIPTCGLNTTNMFRAYYNCSNLIGYPISGQKVEDMSQTYYNCRNMIGSPVCGPNVNNMSYAYTYCLNIIGPAACGDKVLDMGKTYQNCYNLTGSPVCGTNVTNMSWTYHRCNSLTGSPVCENNVINMYQTYNACTNLSGNPVCGPNVTCMADTYNGCPNLYGDMWMNYNQNTSSSAISDGLNCFLGRNNQNRLNIHVPAGYAWDNWLYHSCLFYGTTKLSWTTMENGYYNSMYNTYVYNNVIL